MIRIGGAVPRCVLTARDPVAHERDLDTPRAILAQRRPMASGEPPFAVYATVVKPGTVRPSDAVAPLG